MEKCYLFVYQYNTTEDDRQVYNTTISAGSIRFAIDIFKERYYGTVILNIINISEG